MIARFPLAVRDEAEQTTWHTILAFNERARKLAETLTKGQLAEVIGYVHERQVKGRSHQPKMVEEVYAAVVKPRT